MLPFCARIDSVAGMMTSFFTVGYLWSALSRQPREQCISQRTVGVEWALERIDWVDRSSFSNVWMISLSSYEFLSVSHQLSSQAFAHIHRGPSFLHQSWLEDVQRLQDQYQLWLPLTCWHRSFWSCWWGSTEDRLQWCKIGKGMVLVRLNFAGRQHIANELPIHFLQIYLMFQSTPTTKWPMPVQPDSTLLQILGTSQRWLMKRGKVLRHKAAV